ncbi:YoaK family protein [Burkholderia plantarii]|uniref:YoaK family protein n=1 Tax=Burkholderia plantarii TaxID=41899 RepID=UPI001F5B7FD3|nr:YoaK family protein [Burkholderia plantarii]
MSASPGARWMRMAMRHENVLLAFVAGYVDTLGFVALFGLFVAHVTGNFILIGSGIAGAGGGVLVKLLAFPAFVAGIVGARFTAGAVADPATGGTAAWHAGALYGLQLALLAAFMLAGLAAAPIVSIDAPLAMGCGLLGAAAMGVQNAHAKLATRGIAANTVMTGNVTQAVLDVYELVAPGSTPAQRRETRGRLARMLPPIAAFALGAGGGALGWRAASFWALGVPLALLAALALASVRGAAPEAAPAR